MNMLTRIFAISRFFAVLLSGLIAIISAAPANAQSCSLSESTAANPSSGKVDMPWRTDFPTVAPTAPLPWSSIDFMVDWKGYMSAVLGSIRGAGLQISSSRLTMPAGHPWWIVPWMDYSEAGRERFNGLTKERSSIQKDLGPNADRAQLWAIGWYNAVGAFAFGKIFADPCQPTPSAGIPFPQGTAAVKFLFTDVDPATVNTGYLQGSPEIHAFIDAQGVFGPSDPKNRVDRVVRLLQVDIGVRDSRATETGWVFGTFVWRGPPKGDRLFDNLEPVGLQWGNSPFAKGTQFDTPMGAALTQQRIDNAIETLLSGWTERPWLGFQGRVNGPADNKLSSCLSCHGAAQTPRSFALGFVESGAGPVAQPGDTAIILRRKVARHVFAYFRNIRPGEIFDVTEPDAIPLDYSLQLESSFSRMCKACAEGKLSGLTPQICALVHPVLAQGATMPKPGQACGSPSIMQLKAAGQPWEAEMSLSRQ
jgi:hypothetical protein